MRGEVFLSFSFFMAFLMSTGALAHAGDRDPDAQRERQQRAAQSSPAKSPASEKYDRITARIYQLKESIEAAQETYEATLFEDDAARLTAEERINALRATKSQLIIARHQALKEREDEVLPNLKPSMEALHRVQLGSGSTGSLAALSGGGA